MTRSPDHARSRRFFPLSPVPCNLFPFLSLIGNSYRNDLISLFTRFISFSINLLNRLYTFSSVLPWRRRPFHRSSERRTPDDAQTPGCAKHLPSAVLGLASNLSPIDSHLAAEYGVRSGRVGHV